MTKEIKNPLIWNDPKFCIVCKKELSNKDASFVIEQKGQTIIRACSECYGIFRKWHESPNAFYYFLERIT